MASKVPSARGGIPLTPFDAAVRTAALERMAEDTLDLLVVGGGITGAGIALDGASRGLRVALVERDDFAAGTSGRSSRFVHGGIRYLQQGEFGLVHESLRERAILLRLAPHLVRPTPMYAPVPRLRHRLAWRVGLGIYDALAAGRNVGRHRGASPGEVARVAPGMARPARAVVYHECRTDDARLTLEVVRAAAAHGALVANHAAAQDFLGRGRVTGARVRDTLSGQALEIRARLTVNATGVWADRVQALATGGAVRLQPSKGVHLVFGPGAVATRHPLVVPSAAHDGRFVFIVPWAGRVYAGTTDTPYEGELDEPAVDEEDRAYVVAAVARAFPAVTEADVVAAWAGLRPLLRGREGPTADLSRKHAISEGPPGLLTITGGKLTTYRAMAEELVDRAVRALGGGERSRTAGIRLGLTGALGAALERAAAAAPAAGLSPEAGRRLVLRFGDDWEEAIRRVREEPSLATPVAEGAPVLEVERELARDREMAVTEEDVLVRRTRLATLGVPVPGR